jgi:thiol-disulfide isomerase/thioredoxin
MTSSLSRVGAVLLIVAAAGAAGYLASRYFKDSAGPSFEESVNEAAAAAANANGHVARAVGAAEGTPARLPQLTLPDVDGKPRSLSEWKGRPLLINFWATWCEPCRREIPLLVRLRAEHAKEGLEVIGIAIDFQDAVKEYAGKTGMTYPVLIAEQDATAPRAFGVGMGLPTTVLAARDGRIVAHHVREQDEAEAKQLLAGVL